MILLFKNLSLIHILSKIPTRVNKRTNKRGPQVDGFLTFVKNGITDLNPIIRLQLSAARKWPVLSNIMGTVNPWTITISPKNRSTHRSRSNQTERSVSFLPFTIKILRSRSKILLFNFERHSFHDVIRDITLDLAENRKNNSSLR